LGRRHHHGGHPEIFSGGRSFFRKIAFSEDFVRVEKNSKQLIYRMKSVAAAVTWRVIFPDQ
jgi:hypothetical protein